MKQFYGWVTTTWGTVLKDRSMRRVENHWFRMTHDSDPVYLQWQLVLLDPHPRFAIRFFLTLQVLNKTHPGYSWLFPSKIANASEKIISFSNAPLINSSLPQSRFRYHGKYAFELYLNTSSLAHWFVTIFTLYLYMFYFTAWLKILDLLYFFSNPMYVQTHTK